ncbi:neurogenic locus notch homolog protein 1-like [Limulus polyphemus]|uniref:Neurogenic locus notch homolog protein 1-like n=1 Tax=Limulus polyphemus TaxID=6850 RepID=A0ABM1STC9_LIMPO|nr:neurogenic locus notch homolog protein 1-like [Limulus polyphemus]
MKPGLSLTCTGFLSATQTNCNNNPCQHNGTCHENLNYKKGFKCDCPRGYCGERCEQFYYDVTYDACTLGKDLKGVDGNTLEYCLEWCLETPNCHSVDFVHSIARCVLNDDDHTDIGLQEGCAGQSEAAYYYIKDGCVN